MARSSSTKRSNADGSPKFFKIYLSKFSSERLRIPQPFIKEFNGDIPKKAVLQNFVGRLWHVELQDDGDHLFIQNGWQSFVTDNSVENGDFLVFTYSQSCTFDVGLYDKDGDVKDCLFVENAINKDGDVNDSLYVENFTDKDGDLKNSLFVENATPYVAVKEEEESKDEKTCSQRTRKHKFSETGLQSTEKSGVFNTGSPGVRQCKVKRTSEAAAVGARKNPYFITSVGKSSHHCVSIPKKLVTKNGIQIEKEMKLRDENGMLWPVNVTFRKDGRITMSGWLDFMERKNLGLQDQCVFELVLKGRICNEMRVQIIRALPQKSNHH